MWKTLTHSLNSPFSALFMPRDSTQVGEGRVQANLYAHAQTPPLPPVNDLAKPYTAQELDRRALPR